MRRRNTVPRWWVVTLGVIVVVVVFDAGLGGFAPARWFVEASSSSSLLLSYGVDVSLPTTRSRVETPNPLGDHRQAAYEALMEGCNEYYSGEQCAAMEATRLSRNARRPGALKNFTATGFAKTRTPPGLWSLVEGFWKEHGDPGHHPNQNNKHSNWIVEDWGNGETVVNHWEAPSSMVSLHNESLRGGGPRLEQAVWEYVRPVLEEWTGKRLRGCSVYGIRVYTEGSVLLTHVDRIPLVVSAIIHVAQNTPRTAWPLEVIGHDGVARNITTQPGDLVLYESHSILHGRPFRLEGEYVANLFVHFEVLPDDGDTNARLLPYVDYDAITGEELAAIMGENANHHHRGGDEPEQPPRAPPPLLRRFASNAGPTWLHTLAGNGRTEEIAAELAQMPARDALALVVAEDEQGWQPIHEAARGGHTETLGFLLGAGADLHAVTNAGETATYLAQHYHSADSGVATFLESRGGVPKPPVVEFPHTLPHQLAGDGLLEDLRDLVRKHPKVVHALDDNGWTPLHEAARMGHGEVAAYLLEQGADPGITTAAGRSALDCAVEHHGEGSAIYGLLQAALEPGPDL